MRAIIPDCQHYSDTICPRPGGILLSSISDESACSPWISRVHSTVSDSRSHFERAALTPFHGVFAPNRGHREHVVPRREPKEEIDKRLAPVQRDARDPNRKLGTLPVADRVFGRQRPPRSAPTAIDCSSPASTASSNLECLPSPSARRISGHRLPTCGPSPHIATRAAMIAQDFAVCACSRAQSIATPMVERACARNRQKDRRGRGQRSLYPQQLQHIWKQP